MTDVTKTVAARSADPTGDRRRPRRPGRGLVAGGLAVVLAAIAAVTAWLAVRDDTEEPAAFDSPCGTVVPAAGGTPTMRIVLIGDSLMSQPACEIGAALAPAGVETHIQSVAGSGLLTGAVDWRERLGDTLAAVDADAVLAIFVGNYPPPPARDRSGQPIAADTPAFFEAWQRRARQLSDMVRDAGARLFWVEPPPAAARAAILFDGYRELGDEILPSGRALAGPDGEGLATRRECGPGPLRAEDGLHLSELGTTIFARQIAHDLTVATGLPLVEPLC